jgi:hypothetical protein
MAALVQLSNVCYLPHGKLEIGKNIQQKQYDVESLGNAGQSSGILAV